MKSEISEEETAAAKIVNDHPENSRDAFSPEPHPNTAMQGFMGMAMMEQILREQGKLPQQQDGIELMGLVPCMTQPEQSPAQNEAWRCECGAENTGRFCANCGSPKPEGK
jgi:membrane protease subunit (stomatin/prohibitin family)